MKLRQRLLVLFGLSVLAALAVASFLAWCETREEIYEILDAQQLAFLKHLAMSDVDALVVRSADYVENPDDDKGALAFAVYDAKGRLLLNRGLYGLISPDPPQGEEGIRIGTQSRWRAFWQRVPPDGEGREYLIVVGQHLDYRDEAALKAVEAHIVPWLFLFPLLIAGVLWLLNREFRPIENISRALEARNPDDETPIEDVRIPSEIRPLVDKLNLLFVRMGATLRRERRFTADAAHELRSPLAGLRVQAEVAQMAGDDVEVRERALFNLTQGIDRTARLVEQLLTLSRLDVLGDLAGLSEYVDGNTGSAGTVDLLDILSGMLPDFKKRAEEQGTMLEFRERGDMRFPGSRTLIATLIRNLLDNALKYVPPGGLVEVTLTDDSLIVTDDGPGVDAENLPRLGERFFRVPGQKKIGTGLGLSIVSRIAALHDMSVEFRSPPGCGLCVTLRRTGRGTAE